MDVKALQNCIEGKVTVATDAGYEDLRRSLIWNQLTPMRYPQVVVQVANEEDVVEAVRFARRQNMKIAVRGGGHSWVGFPLCNGSLLIDLGRLNRVSIDHQTRTASIQPAVTGQALNQQLASHGLAFPVGHCATVPMSGYLLNGGLGWNWNTWGPACFSVEAANVVLADGSLVVADQEQHADLLWAIRGAGPGFFGVVTQYFLKLYPMPRAITTSTYYYPLERIAEVGAWAAGIAGQLPREVELAIFCAQAPPAFAERCRSSNGFICILSATGFFDTPDDAAASHGLLKSCPVLSECLGKDVNQPASMDALLDMGGRFWPELHRCLADTVWSNSPPEQQLAALRDAFLQAPSPESLALCAFSTGVNGSAALRPDAAFSMTASTLLLNYAIWERPADDDVNADWHRATLASLDRFAVGHYVGESDIVENPRRAEGSFAPAIWQRLQALRRTYDPDGFFSRSR
ncbi:FAD-binding oxidoreductase [Candidatus Nitrospira allomarina]|jgi:FAD/FMN-containing dehydrogenase|uniref:FAD-binding oxidoreductase n=1 Tax=Candidatus Nitrospira allomarina TaxID=3020900 RepID=A0AA96GD44_9BACT|nr:FAD-binding oxidoreductase [Candidatus Nitrospira allomarina]WNM57725.1 FAD-binding oxidoreductase [Candidatus Nitrospira allomarina]